MKMLYDGKYRKPGKPIGEIIKDGIAYDYNFCENELIIDIDGKFYKGMRVVMLREIEHENQEESEK